jgi:hypothetical protein
MTMRNVTPYSLLDLQQPFQETVPTFQDVGDDTRLLGVTSTDDSKLY